MWVFITCWVHLKMLCAFLLVLVQLFTFVHIVNEMNLFPFFMIQRAVFSQLWWAVTPHWGQIEIFLNSAVFYVRWQNYKKLTFGKRTRCKNEGQKKRVGKREGKGKEWFSPCWVLEDARKGARAQKVQTSKQMPLGGWMNEWKGGRAYRNRVAKVTNLKCSINGSDINIIVVKDFWFLFVWFS